MKWVVLVSMMLLGASSIAMADSQSDYDAQQQGYGPSSDQTDTSEQPEAQPENWNDRDYRPNEADNALAAKTHSNGDPKKEREMNEALCSFYQNCK